MNSIAEYNGPAEREPRLRAVPLHELFNGVPVDDTDLRAVRAFQKAVDRRKAGKADDDPFAKDLKSKIQSWWGGRGSTTDLQLRTLPCCSVTLPTHLELAPGIQPGSLR